MLGHRSQREIERRSATVAIACCRVCLPDTASSDTCACCIMLVCTHLLGSCHQQRKDNMFHVPVENIRQQSMRQNCSILGDSFPPNSLFFGTFSRPCRPTLWHKLAQVEQVQAPSWYRACAMAQGKASIVGI